MGIFAGGLEEDSNYSGKSTKYLEAISALVVLGYNQFEANKAISEIYDNSLEVEQLIMAALKGMNR